jgi:hypothetical protein
MTANQDEPVVGPWPLPSPAPASTLAADLAATTVPPRASSPTIHSDSAWGDVDADGEPDLAC